jgi:hypothetical protein
MQLHRRPKSKIGEMMFGKGFSESDTFTVDQLAQIFREQPFSFEDPMENRLIARYLLEPTETEPFITEAEIA